MCVYIEYMHIIKEAVAIYYWYTFCSIALDECNSKIEDSPTDSCITTTIAPTCTMATNESMTTTANCSRNSTSNDMCCSTIGTSKQPVKSFVLHWINGTIDARKILSVAPIQIDLSMTCRHKFMFA